VGIHVYILPLLANGREPMPLQGWRVDRQRKERGKRKKKWGKGGGHAGLAVIAPLPFSHTSLNRNAKERRRD